jgi:hypothetical protein
MQGRRVKRNAPHLAPDPASGSRARFHEWSRFLRPSHFGDFVDLDATWSLNLDGRVLGLAINARAIGEVTEIFPVLVSSRLTNDLHTFFSPLSALTHGSTRQYDPR